MADIVIRNARLPNFAKLPGPETAETDLVDITIEEGRFKAGVPQRVPPP